MAVETPATANTDESNHNRDHFEYDAFLSYSTRTDYAEARRIESFLESFHKTPAPPGASIRRLQICRDGSDFKLPSKRDAIPDEENDPVWRIIRGELSKARYLIVLCSPGGSSSRWVSREISWMLDHRGSDWILPVITSGNDPTDKPEEVFPAEIRAANIEKSRLWYDLRGLTRSGLAVKVRDSDDEMVRLASDLLAWDSSQYGPLAAIWEREQLRKRRRLATVSFAVAAVLILLASLAIWRSLVASREAQRARANAVVLAADASPDPLTGALLLIELAGNQEPDDGMRVARRLAATLIPKTLIRGHTARLSNVVFSPNQTRVLTASEDGTARICSVDGKGDPTVLHGHTNGLTAAIFNSDGSLVATASKDKTARIWAETGKDAIRTFEHDGPVLSAQFSFDNQWLATVSGTGAGQLWRIQGSERLIVPLPDNRKVVRIWLSPERLGGWAAGDDGSLWGLESPDHMNVSVTRALESAKEKDDSFPDHLLDKISFSKDGSHVAVVFDKKALLRRTDNTAAVVLAHDELINSMDFNRDGSRAVTACSDGRIRLWDTATGALIKTLDPKVHYWALDLFRNTPDVREETSLSARAALFSQSGSKIVGFFEDGVIRIWDTNIQGRALELRGNPGAEVAEFSDDDMQLVTGDDEGTARIWLLVPPSEPLVFQHPKPVYAACVSKDGSKVATGSSDGIARVWMLSDMNRKVELNANAKNVRGVVFNKAGTLLATAHEDGTARLWDISDLDHPVLRKQFGEPGERLNGLQFSPDELKLLTWSTAGYASIRQIDGLGGELILRANSGEVWYAEFSPDGKHVLAIYDDGSARIWNANGDGHYVLLAGSHPHTDKISGARFSPDGSRVLTVSHDGTGRIWRSSGVGDPTTIRGPNPGKDWLDSCAFSPNGDRVAITSSAGRAWVWAASGQGNPIVLRATGDLAHIGPISSVAFSQDGLKIVTAGGMDGSVRVWQADGKGKPAVLSGHEGAITWADFSPDGSRVITASEDGSARVWRASWSDLLTYLRSRTSASLTPEQRIIYLGETEPDARRAYEQAERQFGRTPLPPDWQFSYPF